MGRKENTQNHPILGKLEGHWWCVCFTDMVLANPAEQTHCVLSSACIRKYLQMFGTWENGFGPSAFSLNTK